MRITPMILSEFATNCYIVQGPDPARCLVVDPAGEGERLLEALEGLHTRPEALLLTHGHYDHLLAVPQLQARWPDLPVYCHRADCPAELTEDWDGVAYPTATAFPHLRHYGEGDTVEAAGLTARVLHTPGHTRGSVTLLMGDALFTGDTLFQGDMGSTEYDGGDEEALLGSLARLAELPGDYRVLPGHDETTTLERERRENPCVHLALGRRSGKEG